MAAADLTSVDGWWKNVWSEGGLENAVPAWAELSKRIPFGEQEKLGKTYNFPVLLRRSHGVTIKGAAGTVGTVYTLNDPTGLTIDEAAVSGTECILQEDISYGAINRAQKGGKASFGDFMDMVVMTMKESLDFYREMMMLYGGQSIGIADAGSSASGTAGTFVVSKTSWAPGLWTQMEGAYVDIYTDGAFGTQLNNSGTVQVTAINPSTRALTLLMSSSGDCDALTTGYTIVPRGWIGEAFTGVTSILQNTGTLFGIPGATYSLWKGNTFSAASSKLTMRVVMNALTQAVVRGLNEKVAVFCSTYGWSDLNNDLAALRRFAENTKNEMEIGTESIKFYGVNGGTVELVPHAMVKAGHALAVPVNRVKRRGSTDTTFKLMGVKEQSDKMYQDLETKSGIRLRCMWDQAICMTTPARGVEISTIVNESL